MRWLVEVTSLGRTEKDSLYVDADSWQKALTVARTLRGETDPMTGFSIELLEEGCRAVDPATRMSYEVHRAPGRRAACDSPSRRTAEGHAGPALGGPALAAGHLRARRRRQRPLLLLRHRPSPSPGVRSFLPVPRSRPRPR